jgi:poly(ADP-ribose) glycohydrolase
MSSNEAILIRGTEQFSVYSGYGFSFEYAGPYVDTSPVHEDGFRDSLVVAYDALAYYADSLQQFSQKDLLRDINKVRILDKT